MIKDIILGTLKINYDLFHFSPKIKMKLFETKFQIMP